MSIAVFEPPFKKVFGADWKNLPPVLKAHYDVGAGSRVVGEVSIKCRGLMRWLAPLFWLIRGVPPVNEDRVPTEVDFSVDDKAHFHFRRHFQFGSRKPYRFHSVMRVDAQGRVIEQMGWGVSWRFQLLWQDEKIVMHHRGFGLSFGNNFVPLPLTWLLGAAYAEEIPQSNDSFRMEVSISHPLWGQHYRYYGEFRVVP